MRASDTAVVVLPNHAHADCAVAGAEAGFLLFFTKRHAVLFLAEVRHGEGLLGFTGFTSASLAGGLVVGDGEGAPAFILGGLGELLETFETGGLQVCAGGAVGGGVDAVDAGGEDELGCDDAHGLFAQVRGDGADDVRVVEESLLADADVGREAGLALLGAPGGDVAGGGFGETSEAAGGVEELCSCQRADEGCEVGREEVHARLDVFHEGGFGVVEGDAHVACLADAEELFGAHFLAFRGGCFHGHDHERWAVEDGLETDANGVVGGCL